MNESQTTPTLPDGKVPENLRELLESRVEATPDKNFLFAEVHGRSFTYREFDEMVNRTANMLLSHGIGKGDTVSLLMPNSAGYIIAYFACFKLGAVAGPVNSLLKAQEIKYVIGNSDARALLIGSEFVETINEIRQELPALRAIIQLHDVADATFSFSPKSDAFRNVEISRDDEAVIIYTSGTTGKPKGCLLSHGNLIV